MNRRSALVVAAAVLGVGVAVLLGVALTGRSGPSGSPVVGSPAPALAGTTLTGHRFRLGERPGTVTVVNVWASWCGPCRNELPLVADFARRWSGRGVQVVGVDTRDGDDAARSLLEEVGASDLATVPDPRGTTAVSWGATGVPETFVVDAHGVVRSRHIGELTPGWLEDQVERWATR